MSAPSRILVVGRDADLWLAAAALARAFGPSGVSVDAVELPSKLPAWAVYPTLPSIEALHRKLGIDETALIQATGGSYSSGWLFGEGGEGFFHAWGSCGRNIADQDFLPCWLRAARLGLKLPFQDFSLSAVAARAGRMLVPDEEIAAFARTDHAYHLPAHLYSALLRDKALRFGAIRHSANEVSVELAADGSIAAVLTDEGQHFPADLFVDASGADAALNGAVSRKISTIGHRYVNRILTSHAPRLQRLHPFAMFRPSEFGWTALFPTQSGTQVLHAYARELATDELAIAAASTAARHGLGEIAISDVAAPADRPHWIKNVVALGAAAVSLDPIHGPDLHIVQLGIVHLLNLFPVAHEYSAERTEYNRVLGHSVSRMRDFQTAYYRLNPNSGSFWSRAHSLPISAELEHRIATFAARAEVAPMEHDSFSPDNWRALLIGLRVLPESWPPAADLVPTELLGSEIHSSVEFIRAKVLQQPDHGVYLQRIASQFA